MAMNPERWEQVQAILAELEEAPEEERARLLDERCGADRELLEEVESLLAASAEAGSFFDDLAERAITPLSRMGEPAESPSLVGVQVAQFRIVDKLGEGGMGVVYRATDLELRRDVAIKVLPERLGQNPRQVARFKREAQMLASLSHPGIGAIYGLQEVDGRTALVLELVDGPTLAERMSGRPLRREEALEIARQVACALEAAHALGIVHRDLKPSNVKVTDDGTVKVLDFGIAKAVHGDDPNSDRSPATSELLAATHTGQVVGTVSYMSPERLKGKKVDPRSDVWAFGAVLFEMLSGRRPFPADSFAETLVGILEREPAWDLLPAGLPDSLRRLLERCLERDVSRRLQSVGEARIVLEDALAGSETAAPSDERAPPTAVRRRARVPWPWVAAALAGIGVVLSAAWVSTLRRVEAPARIERFVSPFRAGQQPILFGAASFFLSPDGSTLVYRGPGEGGSGNRLWVRRWAELDAVPLRGTESATAPAISPDGREVAFSQQGEIRVASLEGGPARRLTSGIAPSWGPDGAVYATAETGVVRVLPGGAGVEPVTRRAEGEGNHYLIDVLPGGDRALISVERRGEPSEIRVVSLDAGEQVPVTAGAWPRYVDTGHLLYLLDGALIAAPFDAASGRVTGPSVHALPDVLAYAVADDGTLVYSSGLGTAGRRSELVWFSRSGEATPVEAGWSFDDGGANAGWSLSPDGRQVALRIGGSAGLDIWVKDLEAGTLSRLTFDAAEDRKPRWSPDGASVLYVSRRRGDLDVWTRRADGTGPEELVHDHPTGVAEAAWSPDAAWLVIRTAGTQDIAGGRDVVGIDMAAGGRAVPLLAAGHDEAAPAVSPDGRWLAYSSTETGRYEVYVRPFPDVDAGVWQVTTDGGSAPVWARDGGELYYVDAGRRLTVVRFAVDPRFRVLGTQPLFTIPAGVNLAQVSALYDVSPDGQRFLMGRVYGGTTRTEPELVVVRNFFQELTR
jgi:serine/threonine-protein kinase